MLQVLHVANHIFMYIYITKWQQSKVCAKHTHEIFCHAGVSCLGCCSELQCVASSCSVLQFVARECRYLQYVYSIVYRTQ